jgi:hypothetical protein
MFNADQMNIIWNAAKNTKNQGEVAVFNRINNNPALRGQFDDIQLNIIKYCAEECKRQMSGNMSVYNMVDAWAEAISFSGLFDGHAYEANSDNVCITCGITGSYGHTQEYHDKYDKPNITLDMIERFGVLVEPQKNMKGYRTIRIGVGNGLEWIEKVPPERVIPQLTMLLESYYEIKDRGDAFEEAHYAPYNRSSSHEDSFYYEYEQIHPFVDGNGRTGKIVYNYLKGTLLDPQMPPDFYGVGNP